MIALGVISFLILLLTWAIYPLVIALWSGARRGPARLPEDDTRPVAVIIATREAPDVVSRRVDDLLKGRYPRELLQVIVAVDARSPFAPERYAAELRGRALIVQGDDPGGKAAALNAGVRAASNELLLFADSHQTFAPDAIALLVGALRDSWYAAVSGAVLQDSGDRIVDLYWRYELLIRRAQAAIHSIVSTSGQICIMRRSLWEPLPAELICDDLYITMRLVLRGYRVGFCEAARATDSRQFTKRQHFQRKVRTLTGLFQFISWVPEVLIPWRNPIWTHFVCHKLMRFVAPYLSLLVVLGAAMLFARMFGAVLWAAVGVIAAGVAVGVLTRPALARRFGTQIGWALCLQAAPVVATVNGVRKRWAVWPHHQPLREPPPLGEPQPLGEPYRHE